MNANGIGVGLVVFLVLLVCSQVLQHQRQSLRNRLNGELTTREDLMSIKSQLEHDIERAETLLEEIAEELSSEKQQYELLSETLANVESRLAHAEDLRHAVHRLRIEYEAFKKDVEDYNMLRANRGQ